MPRDIIMTSRDEPQLTDLIRAAADTDNTLRIRTLHHQTVTQILTADGKTVLSVNKAHFIQAPHETTRLLFTPDLEPPVWWSEAWAPWGSDGELGITIMQAYAARLHCGCYISAPV